jgi:hypothetical protein
MKAGNCHDDAEDAKAYNECDIGVVIGIAHAYATELAFLDVCWEALRTRCRLLIGVA